MHILDAIAQRSVPAAGLYMALTRRCPLACAHCSTQSLMSSEEYDESIFETLARTFTPDDRPEILLLTGGEALLRPALVRRLTDLAHAVSTSVYLISGMFFARQTEIPPAIRAAVAGVDHFVASLDVFHEAQVPRAAVFRALHEILDLGTDVSVQVTGTGPDDPYLADVTADLRRTFDDRVPAVVTQVSSVGRAKEWLPAKDRDHHVSLEFAPMPCVAATWPVVTFDGTVVACCNQNVVDGPPPPHLRLGHAATDSWPTIRARLLTAPMIRGIRIFGPEFLAATYGSERISCEGMCATCYQLSDDPVIAEDLESIMARETMGTVERLVATMQQEDPLGGYLVPPYAYMASLGHRATDPDADDALTLTTA